MISDSCKPPQLASFWRIFETVDRLGGSISAEHGVGRVKRAAFLQRSTPLDIGILKGIKVLFDPRGLMSPGRILE